jgi:hypothetical protein
MGVGRGVYKFCFGGPQVKRPLKRPRHRQEMELREVGIDGANWIWLAQDRVQWWAFVNMAMNLWAPKRKQDIF